ncbi:TC.FEV.OM, iron complex outermembrane recepter protein [Nostoc flagelliforme CCNUN1]|uniref:TC.FEV.OM, iron complex outermembrane recepter protein n=1 Tax=Nostoc flagelliforme CCNUN1 TaxID=2038116 RepID=A0A2K8T1M2_9NOSO|nr:TonB-dependent siderophore receptor [Nostoc flagelliforme]AUB41608.1 TC.FEV.OM, iron complex outermembrane recepter protein [Nostoc flagelliforme CCNUN1]
MPLEPLVKSLLFKGLVSGAIRMKSGLMSDIRSVGLALAVISSLVQPAHAGTHTTELSIIDSQKSHSTNSAQLLGQRNDSSITKVTAVRVNSTDKGIEVILESPNAEALKPVNSNQGNSFIADIPNAVLELPESKDFSIANPGSGVVSVSVTQADANTVRVTVTGEAGLPTAELFDSDEGLVFELAPVASATERSQPPEQPTSETERSQPPEQPTSETQPSQAPEQPTSETQPSQPPEQPTAESETPPEQPTAESDEPIELVVTGEQDGYRVPTASTATKTDTPLRDVPQAIQVIPRQVLQDQQVRRLNEALRNAPGVIANNSERSAFEGFTIRGFSNRNIIRNGLRDDTNITTNVNIENIEQIEVLRGPASVLFGQGGAGGTINIVTKKPQSTPYYFIEGTIGSFDTYGGSIDFTGPLNDDRTLLYRLNASAYITDTFVDFFETERYFIAPSLTWLMGKNTELTLEAEYSNQKQPNDRGLPAVGTVLPNPNGKLPINRFIGEPFDEIDKNNRQSLRIGYNFEHRFSENWQFRNNFNFSYLSVEQNSLFPSALLENNRTLERGLFIGEFAEQAYNLDTNIVGNFKTGSIDHKLLFGVDLSREVSYQEGRNFLRELDPIDIFNPIYRRESAGADLEEFADAPTISQGLGIYLQDQISLLENLKLVLGGRFDIVTEELEDSQGETTAFQQDEAFSPRVGIVYQPSEAVSLYANYSRSFQQVTDSTSNRLFVPERGTLYELGMKVDWTNNLSSTIALYQITRSNVLTTDISDPSRRTSIQTGEQRSRGIDLDITGEILPGWRIIGSYAYTDAQVTKDNEISEGNRINNVPEHAFSLWSRYDIQQGNLQGLGFGLGLFYVGERQGDLNNSFSLPSYVRTDAALFYRRDNFRAALNFQNLFDNEYFETAESDLRVFPGAPRTIKFTLGWEL